MTSRYIGRRLLLQAGLASSWLAAIGCSRDTTDPAGKEKEQTPMYGIIGKLITVDGQRDSLIDILLDGTKDMPGCLLYAISADNTDTNGIWITEYWETEAHHQASLQLPSVQAAIEKGKPMIAGFGERHIVTPRGGAGLSR